MSKTQTFELNSLVVDVRSSRALTTFYFCTVFGQAIEARFSLQVLVLELLVCQLDREPGATSKTCSESVACSARVGERSWAELSGVSFHLDVCRLPSPRALPTSEFPFCLCGDLEKWFFTLHHPHAALCLQCPPLPLKWSISWKACRKSGLRQ